MDVNDQQQEVLWTFRWEIQPAPAGLAAWLVDDAGKLEPAAPSFLAFQVRDASIRTYASVPKFAQGGRRGGQYKFAEPPDHFLEVTSGETGLWEQEVYGFLPAQIPVTDRMPWFRVGVHLFFQEEEARGVAEAREAAQAGANALVATAAAGAGGDAPRGEPQSDDS